MLSILLHTRFSSVGQRRRDLVHHASRNVDADLPAELVLCAQRSLSLPTATTRKQPIGVRAPSEIRRSLRTRSVQAGAPVDVAWSRQLTLSDTYRSQYSPGGASSHTWSGSYQSPGPILDEYCSQNCCANAATSISSTADSRSEARSASVCGKHGR